MVLEIVYLISFTYFIFIFLHLSPKFLNNVFLFVGLTNLGIYIDLIGWFIRLSVQLKIVNHKRDNFVHHYWECKLIYRLLSYSFISLGNEFHLELVFANYNFSKESRFGAIRWWPVFVKFRWCLKAMLHEYSSILTYGCCDHLLKCIKLCH